MFENISKGVWSIDVDKVKQNKHGVTVYPLRIDNAIGEYGAISNAVRVYEPDGNITNAKFIAFAFNLQQRYDISKLKEAVNLLEKIEYNRRNNYEIPIWMLTEAQNILKQIKK